MNRKVFYLVALLLFVTWYSQAFGQDRQVMTSDSVRLFVSVQGQGEPIIFVHGGPGSNSGYLQYGGGDAIHSMAQMIYFDQRGCGRSQNAANGNYSLDRLVEDIEEVRQTLGHEKVTLMAHSFGGIIGVSYAAKYAEHLNGLILLNATLNIDTAANNGIRKVTEILTAHDGDLTQVNDTTRPLLERWSSGLGQLQQLDLFYQLMFSTKKNFELHEEITMRNAHTRDFANKVWGYPEYFSDKLWMTPTIHIPVYIIGGKADYTIGVHHPEDMRFPNQRINYIEGGHALYFEQQPLYVAAMAEYLKWINKQMPN